MEIEENGHWRWKVGKENEKERNRKINGIRREGNACIHGRNWAGQIYEIIDQPVPKCWGSLKHIRSRRFGWWDGPAWGIN